MAEFATDGAVSLFYDNSKKFETTTDGSKVSIFGARTYWSNFTILCAFNEGVIKVLIIGMLVIALGYFAYDINGNTYDWDDVKLVFPIPKSQTDVNPNLVQNR